MNIKKAPVLLLVLILMSGFLVACSEDPSYAIVFNRELDFRSVLDTETGAVFSLGDPREYFEEVFGRGKRNVHSEERSSAQFEGKFEVFDFPRMSVSFLDGKSVSISVGSSSQLELADVYIGRSMSDLPDAFIHDLNFGNTLGAAIYYDSDGNMLTLNRELLSTDWSLSMNDLMAERNRVRSLATYELRVGTSPGRSEIIGIWLSTSESL